MTFLNKIKELGLTKQGRSSKSPAMVRNFFNKAMNKAALIGLFGKKMTAGVTIWQGVSEFDGRAIKVVMSCYATDSENNKTGPLVQVSILPVEKTPKQVYNSKEPTVCGDCKYNGGGCYVQWPRLTGQWKTSQKRHISLELAAWLCNGLRVRIGAAGDPAAVPLYVWQTLLAGADSWTGYTHAWRYCETGHSRYFMASCDSEQEVQEAVGRGWNVFYVHDGKIEEDMDYIKCMADGITKSCFTCMLCHGRPSKRSKPIVIVEKLHGASNTVSKARQARRGA